ncbi:MAG: hypothetical protein BIFFINMI_03560 [Phycisphaerae bacterium]|nr:hypothetical protein [Phycisphaerae bacterium]
MDESSRPPRYLRPYHFAERVHGADFRTTLWASRESQRIRFQVMAETFPLAGKRVLDAGSGMGDFLAYLEEVGQAPASYVGVDALGQVVAEARARPFATPAQFVLADLVEQPEVLRTGDPQVICISGTLNTYTPRLFFKVLDAAWSAAGECLLFNFLSTFHDPKFSPGGDVARRFDPLEVLRHGLAFTHHVILRHDYYHGHDCTMAWLKEGQWLNEKKSP